MVCDWSNIEDDEGYCDAFIEEVGDESVMTNCESGLAAGRCSESQVTQKVSEGPEFLDGPDSEHGPGGPGPGEMLHLPQTHSGLDPSVRELGGTMCLPDHSADIDPGPGEYFPRLGIRLVNPVLLVNCVPDIGGECWNLEFFAECARLCFQLRFRAREVSPGR